MTFQDICIDKIPKYFTSIKDTYYAALKHESHGFYYRHEVWFMCRGGGGGKVSILQKSQLLKNYRFLVWVWLYKTSQNR